MIIYISCIIQNTYICMFLGWQKGNIFKMWHHYNNNQVVNIVRYMYDDFKVLLWVIHFHTHNKVCQKSINPLLAEICFPTIEILCLNGFRTIKAVILIYVCFLMIFLRSLISTLFPPADPHSPIVINKLSNDYYIFPLALINFGKKKKY